MNLVLDFIKHHSKMKMYSRIYSPSKLNRSYIKNKHSASSQLYNGMVVNDTLIFEAQKRASTHSS